ncbi:MAG: hypothetical protein HC804_05200, partial [Anaerolineae bacterium]|nr:hypothetical protein [Anaerolineae bacterium]
MIGQATGGFGGDGSSSTTIRWTIAVTNEDEGEWGAVLMGNLQADPTLEVHEMDGPTAVTQVEDGTVTAALLIPR